MSTKKKLPYDDVHTPEYAWIAWRTKNGWSVSHAVVGAEVMGPEDVKGYYTMCGRIVPETALEVVEGYERGIANSRPIERELGSFTGIVFGPDRMRCRHCLRELDEK